MDTTLGEVAGGVVLAFSFTNEFEDEDESEDEDEPPEGLALKLFNTDSLR